MEGCRVTNCPSLPETEEFAGMWEFQCLNHKSPGQARMVCQCS